MAEAIAWTSADRAAVQYNPTTHDFDLVRDPRCLYGWGPPDCHHMFGHGCFRALGHDGLCGEYVPDPLDCEVRQRPADWDGSGRAEANR